MLSFDPAEASSELNELPRSQGLDLIRGMLAIFLPFGLSDAIDQTCITKLGIHRPGHPVASGRALYVDFIDRFESSF